MRRQFPFRARPLAIVALFLATVTSLSESRECNATLSASDATAIRTVIEAYRTSWLRGDEKGVLATFTPDAVLLPAHGGSPVVGIAAIKSYWWPPEAPPTTITRLDITAEGLQGRGKGSVLTC